MEGLEASVLPLSEVLNENGKARIDSGYFAKVAIAAERKIEGLPNDRLGEITSTFRKGIFDIKADTYVEPNEGVQFVRIGDLKGGLIRKATTAWISHAAHMAEKKTALEYGDLILSKTAYPVAAFVNIGDCNASQDTVAVRLNAVGKRDFRSGFISAYLNGHYGHTLMARRFQGNVQQHLSLEDGKAVRVPKFSTALQDKVHKLVAEADEQSNDIEAAQQGAEATLLAALGLADWTPPEPVAYQQTLSTLQTSKRMDAEHFDPRHLYAEDVIVRRSHEHLADLAQFVSSGPAWPSSSFTTPDDPEGVPFVRIRNCKPGQIEVEDLDRLLPTGIAKFKTGMAQAGDIAVGMDGIKWFFAGVLDGDAYINQRVGWVRLNDTAPSSGYVQLVLNSVLGQAQLLRRMTIAQTVGHITLDDIRSIKIPIFDDAEMASITGAVEDAAKAKVQAAQLLEAAKRTVEIAIENGEGAAMSFLDEAEGAE